MREASKPRPDAWIGRGREIEHAHHVVGDLTATGAHHGGREGRQRRGEEGEERSGDVAVGAGGPRASERGERRGGRGKVGYGGGGYSLVANGLRHGGGGGAEVLEVLPRRAAEAREDCRGEVALSAQKGEVVVAGSGARGLWELSHVDVGHGGRAGVWEAERTGRMHWELGNWRSRVLGEMMGSLATSFCFVGARLRAFKWAGSNL